MSGPDQLQTGESGTFEASINAEADKPLTYQWNFGDGETGSGLLTTHTFQRAGQYQVTFTASNEAGSDTDTLTVMVERPPQPASIASINAQPNPVDEGESVRFTSNVRGDTPLTYNWSFGDGATGSGASVTHTYSDPGEYTVELQASNNAGSDSRTLSVTVEPALPPICTSITEFNPVFFSYNSSTLTDEAQSALQENLDVLNQCSNLSARVEGFAAPGERSPQELSADRARAVAQFYTENGVPGARVMAEGQGEVEGQTSKKGGTRQFRRADSIPVRQ